MMRRARILVAALVLCGVLTGCNAYQTAQKAHDIVAAVVAVAQADLPSLEQAGVFSSAEQAAVGNYLNLATNLNGQYETCITNAQNTMSAKLTGGSSKFLVCLQSFAAGLSNQQELATLRVLNPKAQQQVQLWITAASVGVSSVIAALGGQAQVAPQLAKARPTREEFEAMAQKIKAQGYPSLTNTDLSGGLLANCNGESRDSISLEAGRK